MKRSLNILLTFVLIILLSSCFEPVDNSNWLETLIANAEAGTDTSFTQVIWQYEYEGQTVYYTLSTPGQDANNLYDTNGVKIGVVDGGYHNAGDPELENFFQTAANCSLIWQNEYPLIDDAPLEYHIINRALKTKFPDKAYLHLIHHTYKSLIFDYGRDRYEEAGMVFDSSMFYDYEIKNISDIMMNENYLIDEVRTVPRYVLDNIWNNYDYPLDWQEYYRRYPNSCGVIEISRPGFSSNDERAVVGMGWQFSGDGGHGYIIVLNKINDRWYGRYIFETWVS